VSGLLQKSVTKKETCIADSNQKVDVKKLRREGRLDEGKLGGKGKVTPKKIELPCGKRQPFASVKGRF